MDTMIDIKALTHRYGARVAIDRLDLTVPSGGIFALLGPNGSGKTTLFRILSTLIPPTAGTVRMLGLDLASDRAAIRRGIGVVFQAPGLDKQLTAIENLVHHGHLYGLRGEPTRRKAIELLDRFGLAGRQRERVGTFSGGMRRKVELAKALLTDPELLILDEPSTGLDPAARAELWTRLTDARAAGATIVLTTHLMDEAERCDRLAILHHGQRIALGTPAELRAELPLEILTLTTDQPDHWADRLRSQWGLDAVHIDRTLRIEIPPGGVPASELVAAMANQVESITLGRPTLEDVFIRLTGRRFDGGDQSADSATS